MVGEMTSLRSSGYVDPGWEHGVAQDDKKKKVRCNYCGKVVSGGIYRLKQHLARLSGEVTYCDKAPEEVRFKMRENLEGCRFSKKLRRVEYDEQTYLNFHVSDDAEEEDQIGYKNKGKQLANDKGLVINLTPLRSLGYVDPGWEHGVPQDERKKKVKCNYCEKIVSGGINRFKQHLARIPGEVAPLHHMSNEKLLIGDKRINRDSGRLFKGTSCSSVSEPLLKRSKFDTFGARTPKTPIQAPGKKVKTGSNKKSRKEVMSAICKFFYHAGVPPHAANSPYFHKMLELVGQYGQDLVGPSSQVLSGRFLQDEILTIKNHLAEYKSSWAVTGCSILADSWQDTQDRTLINILVSCPRGMYFVCSVDATDVVEDSTYLFKLLDGVVEDMGEENVVQVTYHIIEIYLPFV
nr:Alanine--tRNA ligase [Ipomoea batatas]